MQPIPVAWYPYADLRLVPNEKDLGEYQPESIYRSLDLVKPDEVKIIILGLILRTKCPLLNDYFEYESKLEIE